MLRRLLINSMYFFILLAAIGAVCRAAPSGGSVGPGVPDFTVRPGYRVTLVARGLRNARFLQLDNQGRLFVSEPAAGKIVVLSNPDQHGYYRHKAIFLSDYPTVQAMVYRHGWLWFAQTGAIYKTRDNGTENHAGNIITIIPDGKLPHNGGHWWRSLCITKNHIFTSIGDQSNIDMFNHSADINKTRREKIWRFNRNGTDPILWCTGIRNSEMLLMRPGTHDLWGCDEGSDNFGHPLGEKWPLQSITDHYPPDEFNHYVRGGFYGHPFIVGNNIPRYEFLKSFEKTGHPNLIKLAAEAIPPAWDFGAHWSSVSFCFLHNNHFHGGRMGDTVVACHGSWDSAEKLVGYRIEMVLFDPWTHKPYGGKLMVSTLSPNGKGVLARPVNCVQGPKGSIYFSSDSNGCVYRLRWMGEK